MRQRQKTAHTRLEECGFESILPVLFWDFSELQVNNNVIKLGPHPYLLEYPLHHLEPQVDSGFPNLVKSTLHHMLCSICRVTCCLLPLLT